MELEKYLKEDCYPFRLNRVIQIQEFEGFQNIGDIDNDMKDDFVFVLNPLSYCEEGQSYYFSNPTIERIYTESQIKINQQDVNSERHQKLKYLQLLRNSEISYERF